MVDTVESLKHQLGLLGQALGNLLVAQGVIRNIPLTGPELLMIAEDYTEHLREEKAKVSAAESGKAPQLDLVKLAKEAAPGLSTRQIKNALSH